MLDFTISLRGERQSENPHRSRFARTACQAEPWPLEKQRRAGTMPRAILSRPWAYNPGFMVGQTQVRVPALEREPRARVSTRWGLASPRALSALPDSSSRRRQHPQPDRADADRIPASKDNLILQTARQVRFLPGTATAARRPWKSRTRSPWEGIRVKRRRTCCRRRPR